MSVTALGVSLFGITYIQLCKELSVRVSSFENHKTENAYRNAMIIKVLTYCIQLLVHLFKYICFSLLLQLLCATVMLVLLLQLLILISQRKLVVLLR
jgi:hypothetical protein